MTSAANGSRLPSWRRLRHQRDFDRVYAARCRAGDQSLLVFADVGGESRGTRFGLSVSKKHGNAVRRGRLKRLLREAFRLQQDELPVGIDLVLIPRQGGDATLEAFQVSLRNLANKLAGKLAGKLVDEVVQEVSR
ncbi:MAG: ribonuclease P protein component [Planctomycetaceae bacterium]|nr:ribonuclease P protein component [Planctomycetaceae bacterium]